jgi:hypothetical protein
MAAAVLVLGGTVFAQQPGSPPAQQPQAQPQSGQPGGSDVDLSFKQQANLTPQEMLDQGGQDMRQMQDGLKRVVELQELARKQNDIIKLNCVNDKLVQVKAAINIGERATTDMNEAIARNDDGARAHAFTKLTITTQKTQVLVTEAENCVGQDLSFVGQTQVITEVDPNIPSEDPTTPPNPFPPIDRPPLASPFF